MTSTSDPIFSPDGEHMWTGTEWIPAHPDALATQREPTNVDRTSGTLESLSDGPGVIETAERETEGDVLDVVANPEVWSAAPRPPLYCFIFQAAGAIRRGSIESSKQTHDTDTAYYRTTRGVFGSETHRVEDPTWWSLFMMLVTAALFLLSMTIFLIGGAVYLVEASARLVMGAVRKARRDPDRLTAPAELELLERPVQFTSFTSGQELLRIRHEDSVVSAFNSQGTLLATGYQNHIGIWDATTGAQIRKMRAGGWASSVDALVFSPEGTHLATIFSADRTARIWDATSGAQILDVQVGGWTTTVEALAFSPDGNRLATGSSDHTALIWDATSGKELLRIRHDKDHVRAVAFSPDGTRLATSGNDHIAQIWDATTGKELLRFQHGSDVWAVVFSPDGTRLATGDSDDTARIWDATTGKELLRIRHGTGQIRAVAFSPDGTRLATGGNDHTARIWDATTGIELIRFQHDKNQIRAVAFSPDGTRLATGGKDHTARIWDARSV